MDQPIQEAEIVSQSPLPQVNLESIPKLTFPEAIKAVIDGKKITKLEWNDKSITGFLGTDGHLKINLPDKLNDWILSDGDLNGTDYIVVE